MKLFAIAAIIVAIALFLSQTFMRRALNRATLTGVRKSLDEGPRIDVQAVTGSIEGRRHGRFAGVSFVKSTTRGKPDAKSSIEFWCECQVRVPFRAQGRPGALFDRELDLTSSQPEQLAVLQTRPEFAASIAKLGEVGAESVYTTRDRLAATFRPFRRDLLTANKAGEILDSLEEAAKSVDA